MSNVFTAAPPAKTMRPKRAHKRWHPYAQTAKQKRGLVALMQKCAELSAENIALRTELAQARSEHAALENILTKLSIRMRN
jgi:hypothetical protein